MLNRPTERRYGLDLADSTGLATGSLYPILSRLVRAGWLADEWEDIDPTVEGRPRRRFYRLTGEALLAAPDRVAATGLRLAMRPQTTEPEGGTA